MLNTFRDWVQLRATKIENWKHYRTYCGYQSTISPRPVHNTIELSSPRLHRQSSGRSSVSLKRKNLMRNVNFTFRTACPCWWRLLGCRECCLYGPHGGVRAYGIKISVRVYNLYPRIPMCQSVSSQEWFHDVRSRDPPAGAGDQFDCCCHVVTLSAPPTAPSSMPRPRIKISHRLFAPCRYQQYGTVHILQYGSILS